MPDTTDRNDSRSAHSATLGASVTHDRGESGRSDAVRRQASDRVLSPITLRILAINLAALGILVAGLLYLGDYRKSLIKTELAALETQAEMFAVALAEGAVQLNRTREQALANDIMNQMLRRMVDATGTRARLFGINGDLVADSRYVDTRGAIQVETLPPPGQEEGAANLFFHIYDHLVRWIPGQETLPPYREVRDARAGDYDEVLYALSGDNAYRVRGYGHDSMVLSVALPVQRYKQVLGALMLSKSSDVIDKALFDVRLDILKIFAVAIGVTTLLSFYLAGTIARPMLRLAAAADQVRRDPGREKQIPDFTRRNDEIGDLSLALRDMTQALWLRMDAIESFAADVAHEIKNPLTSLRSAVETAARVDDVGRRAKLMAIIKDDVDRLDRLISDISDASRLDAELSRAHKERIDMGAMLSTLVDVYQATGTEEGVTLRLELVDGTLAVAGMEGRLVQVFRNLISNAVTFSPPKGIIRLTVSRINGTLQTEVDDEGPGIPPGKEADIFNRFYTERPEGEKFGTHSGLGLAISKQIVEAHDGTIQAVNRLGPGGQVIGARFIVRLPAV